MVVGVTNRMIDTTWLYNEIVKQVESADSEQFVDMLTALGGEMPDYLRAHLEMEHSTPSPSGVASCRLQQWFKGQGAEVQQGIPASWSLRSMAGTVNEPIWIAILRLCGLPVTFPKESYDCGDHMRAHPDGLIGDDGLLELKSVTGWTYKRLIEGQGVAYEEPKHYTQTQLYMLATGRSYSLYVASTPDPALLQSMMRGWKKYGPEYQLPLCYLEVIPRREVDIEAALARADMIAADKESSTPPPRDFDGQIKWPCSYCAFQPKCQEIYG